MCRVTDCEKKETIIIDVNFSQVICFKNVKRFEMRGALSGFYAPLMLSRPPLDAMPNSMKS